MFARFPDLLPTHYCRLNGSIRSALGEVLGLVALTHGHPQFVTSDLATPTQSGRNTPIFTSSTPRLRIGMAAGDQILPRRPRRPSAS